MTVKGGTGQACAACKYQRRKCSDKCPLAPYFPADDPDRFQDAHRMYGVSNMMKILKQVGEDKKRAAMDTIIFESRMRRRDPVHGCYGIVKELSEQLERHAHVLYRLNVRIQLLREQQFQLHQQFPSQPLYCSSSSTHLQQSSQQPLYASSSSSAAARLQQPMESYNNVNVPVHPYHHHHRHHHPSNQLLINETKGSHVPIDKKISNSLRGQADAHNINGWKNH